MKSGIYNPVITDLEEAVGLLPERYTGNDICRASSVASAEMLAKVHLTPGHYTETLKYYSRL